MRQAIIKAAEDVARACSGAKSAATGSSSPRSSRYGLGQCDAQIERKQRRKHTDQKQASPAEDRQRAQRHDRGERQPDGRRAMEPAGEADAHRLGNRFVEQGRARGPFAADTEAGKEAKHREHRDGRRETAAGREDRIGNDRGAQSANAADPIGEPTPEHRASPAEHENREEQAAICRDIGFAGLHSTRRQQVGEGRDQDEAVEPGVESVEHPTRPGGPEDPCGRGPAGEAESGASPARLVMACPPSHALWRFGAGHSALSEPPESTNS